MRTKRFIYNSVSFAILQALTIAGGLVLTRMYLTTYGSEINGLVISINQFITYFGYVEAGLGTALIYALYKPLADGSLREVDGIVTLARRSYIKASMVYLGLVACLSMIYPFIVKNETTDLLTIALLVMVMGLFGSLEFFTMAKYRVLLVADQREYVISIVLAVAYIVNFILTAYMIHIEAYIVWVRTVPLASFLLRGLLLWIYVKRNYSFITYKEPADTKYLKRRWDALIMQLSVSVNSSAPVVIISVFASLKIASVFSIYNLVFSGLIAITSIFTAGVSASFGNLVANNEIKKLKEVQNQFEFFIFSITAFLYACALILIDSFISLYTKGVTDIDYASNIYAYLFVVWGVLFNVRIPYTALINSAGLYKETRKVNMRQIMIITATGIALVGWFEMTGVLVAMIISVLYWVYGLIEVVKKSMLDSDPKTTYLRIVWMFMIISIATVPFRTFIYLSPGSYVQWAINSLWVAAWCGAVTLLGGIVFDKKAFIEILTRVKGLISRG
ncbi:MAG TPA: hypothetical protein DCG38_05750 [Eubacteriaceae bacterium]|nr:hypothetical protein [Eubacteriaceae bacterium]